MKFLDVLLIKNLQQCPVRSKSSTDLCIVIMIHICLCFIKCHMKTRKMLGPEKHCMLLKHHMIYMRICMYVYLCTNVYMCVYIFACMCICIYMCMYIYLYVLLFFCALIYTR